LRGKASGEGNFLTMKDLERSRKRCSAELEIDLDKDGNPVTRLCNAALWQYVGKDDFQTVRLSAMAALDFLELDKNPVGEQEPRLYDLFADPTTEEIAMTELAYNRVVEHLQYLLNDPSTDVRERVGRILALCGIGKDVTNLGRRDILNLLGSLQDADPVCSHDSVNRQEAATLQAGVMQSSRATLMVRRAGRTGLQRARCT
jgi:hypothetical protein